jgi:prevent-host-death family protein
MPVVSMNIYQAKAHLSKLVAQAEAGVDVILTRDGKPAARITALEGRPRIRFGRLKGQFTVPADFDTPLPDEVLKTFED